MQPAGFLACCLLARATAIILLVVLRFFIFLFAMLASACDFKLFFVQLEAVKTQLDMAMRRIENCPQCSSQTSGAVNPVVLMRQLRNKVSVLHIGSIFC